MQVLLRVLQLRMLQMLARIMFVFYLLSNLIGNFDHLLLFLFVVVRTLLLEGLDLHVLQDLLLALVYLGLGQEELRKFLSLTPSLLGLKVVELVVSCEAIDQTMVALSVIRDKFIFFLLARMSLRVRNCFDIGFNDALHLSLPGPETLLHIVFFKEVYEGLVDLVFANLVQ